MSSFARIGVPTPTIRRHRTTTIAAVSLLRVFTSVNAFAFTPSMKRVSRTVTRGLSAGRDSVPQSLKDTLLSEIVPPVIKASTTSVAEPPLLVLVAGVSGGSDSVALLHALEHCRRMSSNSSSLSDRATQQWRWDSGSFSFILHVAHFDHQRRGEESDLDRQLVHHLCDQYNIPLHTYYWEVDHANSEGQTFSQDAARKWRRSRMREVLQTCIEQYQATSGLFLTAHHQDDSDETLLLKVLRGAHLTKLTGMSVLNRDESSLEKSDRETSRLASPIQDHSTTKQYYWGRPFIHLRKQELTDFLLEHNYVWREDASNSGSSYRRNRVRNELIPLLTSLISDGSLQRRLQTIQEQSLELRKDLECRASYYLEKNQFYDGTSVQLRLPPHCINQTQNTDSPGIDKHGLNLVHKEALHTWAVNQIGDTSFQFTYDKLERISIQLQKHPHNQQWRLPIGGGWDIQRQGKFLRVVRSLDADKTRRADEPLLAMHSLEITTDRPPLEHASKFLSIAIPTDKIEKKGTAKLYRYNSRSDGGLNLMIQPPWQGNSIRLKEFVCSRKIPLHVRDRIPIILLDEFLVAVCVDRDRSSYWIVDYAFHVDRTMDPEQSHAHQQVWVRIQP